MDGVLRIVTTSIPSIIAFAVYTSTHALDGTVQFDPADIVELGEDEVVAALLHAVETIYLREVVASREKEKVTLQ